MKYSRILFLITMYLLCVVSMEAQPQEVLEVETISEMSEKIESTTSKLKNVSVQLNLAKVPIKGSYLNSDWSPAVVYTKTKEFLSCIAKYNIHKNRIEVMANEELRALQVHKISGVIIDGQTFVALSSGESEDGTKPRFFRVLAEGEITLLNKYKLTLHTTGNTALYANIGSKKEYRASNELYYCQNREKAMKLKRGKKNILPLFGAHKTAMEKYADENGLGYRKEKDLVNLFDHFNSLEI